MLVLLVLASATSDVAPRCSRLVPDATEVHQSRVVMPVDLATLRDIGRPDDNLHDSDPVSVSPDGKRIAFQIRRANPDTNSYCVGMAVMDLAVGSRPRLIDDGGDVVTGVGDVRGNADVALGTMTVITPYWSADGQSISYLRREAGSTQIWRTMLDGSAPRQITRLPVDVDSLDRANDRRTLIFRYRPARLKAQNDLDREGRQGFLFDDRFVPVAGTRPFVRARLPVTYGMFDPITGAVANVTSVPGVMPQSGQQLAAGLRGPAGAIARLGPAQSVGLAAPKGFEVRFALSQPKTCTNACRDITGLWWSADGRELTFVRRDGWAESGMAIYHWQHDEAAPRLVWQTEGLLIGCQPTRDDLVCALETATRPRRIVIVACRTGVIRTVFDPNPQFSVLTVGETRRLRWSLRDRTPVFADIVLPVGYRPGGRYPLVIVQYQSRGFLRGGTGDEYPIQALAGRGYMVLSLQQPRNQAALEKSIDALSYDRLVRRNWWLRRRLLELLETGVKQAQVFGADPERIGITGVSDGTSTVIYALANSALIFRAAVISSCCEDPGTFSILGGPAFARVQRSIGYPSWGSKGDPWNRYALSRNRRISTPILMHSADSETGYALEAEAALREHHVPVEMRIFPDERHIKWQPSHRLAIYERTLEWLDFWIEGSRHSPAINSAEVARWRRMRCDAISHGIRIGGRPFRASRHETITPLPTASTDEAKCPVSVRSAPS